MLGPGDGGDLGPGRGGELDLDPAHPAVGAGHQDTAAEQVAGEPQRAQGGQAGQGQGGGLLDAYVGGQRGQPAGWHGGEFGPAFLLHQCHDPAARGWARSVGGPFHDDAGDVLAGAPPAGAGLQQVQFAAVDRKGPDRYQCLPAAGTGVVNRRDGGTVGVVDYSFHGFQSISGTSRDQGALVLCSYHRS